MTVFLCDQVLKEQENRGIYDDIVRMWCDNDAAVLAGSDASSIKRLAYIARRVRFLQELVVRGVVTLLNVPGTANPADMFTKHLARIPFQKCRKALMSG